MALNPCSSHDHVFATPYSLIARQCSNDTHLTEKVREVHQLPIGLESLRRLPQQLRQPLTRARRIPEATRGAGADRRQLAFRPRTYNADNTRVKGFPIHPYRASNSGGPKRPMRDPWMVILFLGGGMYLVNPNRPT